MIIVNKKNAVNAPNASNPCLYSKSVQRVLLHCLLNIRDAFFYVTDLRLHKLKNCGIAKKSSFCFICSISVGIVQNMDWTGLDSWTGQLDWTDGLDHWTGILFY